MAYNTPVEAQHHRGAGGGPVTGFALELLVGSACAMRQGGDPQPDQDLVLGQCGHVGA
jgi:hypothetical protein